MKKLRSAFCIGIGVMASVWNVHATPYASGVTNNNGTIQFYLNETPGSAYVIFENGASNNIASPVVGLNSFALGTHTSYAIYVSKNGAGTPFLLNFPGASGVDTNWPTPRGVAANCNPTNGALFGSVYLANAGAGDTGANYKGQGLFAMHSDLSLAFGTTTNGLTGSVWANSGASGPYKMSVNALDGTVWVGDNSAANGGIFEFDPLLQTTTQVLAGVGETAGLADGTHSVVSGKPTPIGTLASGNLVVWDFDDILQSTTNSFGGDNGAIGFGAGFFNNFYQAPNGTITAPGDYNNVFRYTIGSGPLPWPNAPDLAINIGLSYDGAIYAEADIATNGNIFIASERATYSAPVLSVYDPSGTTNLFCSQTGTGADVIGNFVDTAFPGYSSHAPFSMAVSPDAKYVALLGYQSWIVLINLTNGVPDVTTMYAFPSPPNGAVGRQIGWDAADNLYVASSAYGQLYVYSLGQTTTCITSNDSTGLHGSFVETAPSAVVSVLPTVPVASQNYGTPITGTFTITNSGSTASPVTVYFTLTGTGTNGTTYTISTNGTVIPAASSYAVTIPAGQNEIAVTVTPSESLGSAPTLTATLSIEGSSFYGGVSPVSSTVTIANTGPQELAITGVAYPTLYRGLTNDFASFIVSRYGDTNYSSSYTIPANAFSYSGTAPTNAYSPAAAITVNPGDTFEVVSVTDPVHTGVYVGNESIIVSLNGGNLPSGVTEAGGTQSATLTLIDDANPPETVLWSDPLTMAADSTAWTLTFANSNLAATVVPPIVIPSYPNYTASNPDPNPLDDFDVEFGYDLSSDAVGLSPTMIANGWTTALKVTVNKNTGYNNGNGASAGVNLYPTGKKFSGNYALRFSMNLVEGTGHTTEFDLYGINHYGTNCNWFAEDVSATEGNSTTNSDGIWYWVDSDTDGAGTALGFVQVAGPALPNAGWSLLQNIAATPFTNVFKNTPNVANLPAPYDNVDPGAPADGLGTPANTWSDVEVKQYNGVVTMSINKTPILTYTNTVYAKSGDIMLGYDDPYASIGSSASSSAPGGSVYYSNVRVVSLAGPSITSVSTNGANLVVSFTSPDTDATASSFTLFSTTSLNTLFTATSATITESNGVFQATVPLSKSTAAQFFIVEQSNVSQ